MTSSFPGASRVLISGSLLALTVLAAGCSANSTGAAPPAASAPAATSAPAQTSAPAVTSAPAATSTPLATVAATPACSSRYLRADAGLSQGAAGTIYQTITLTNLNTTPCTLYGYPGVSLAAGDPVTQVGAAANRVPARPATVTLAPRGVASFELQIAAAGDFSSSECDPVSTTWLQVYPPDQVAPLFVSYKSTGCSKSAVRLLNVGSVVSGNEG